MVNKESEDNVSMKIVALIPSYNAGKFLRLSVMSVLRQTMIPSQIVVIDDGSSDGSIDSISDLVDGNNVQIIRNNGNIGKAASLNRCFETIECDYFLLMDADDEAMPNRVERQVDFMQQQRDIGCSGSFVEYISETGRKIGNGTLDLITEERLAEYLRGNSPFGLYCPAVIIRGTTVKDQHLRFRHVFWPADDIDLWNRIAEAGWKVLAQPEFLVRYRIHGNSAVTSNCLKTNMQYEWVKKCLRARRSGNPEPNREEFIEAWRSEGWFRRIHKWRSMSAKCWYRSAGFRYSQKKELTAILIMAAAFCLKPIYVINRLRNQRNGSKIIANV